MIRLLALACVAASLASAAQAADKLVTVYGQATIAAVPDTASIRLGVSSRAKTAQEAGEANAKQMAALIGAIRNDGVAEGDMQTSRLSLQPQYDGGKDGVSHLTGFQATNQITIKIHDIGRLPMLLDRAIAAGANEMSGIEFEVSDQSKLLDQARAQAIEDARRKAELYARAAGAKLGRVVAIAEEGVPAPPRPLQMLRAGAPVPVAPGEQTLRVAVTVSYELAP
jgi:uncharacterized protein YggE